MRVREEAAVLRMACGGAQQDRQEVDGIGCEVKCLQRRHVAHMPWEMLKIVGCECKSFEIV